MDNLMLKLIDKKINELKNKEEPNYCGFNEYTKWKEEQNSNIELLEELKAEYKIENENILNQYTIKTFKNEEGIFAEIFNSDGKSICIGNGDTELTATKDACNVFSDIIDYFNER